MSPQASAVVRPVASSRSQIAGTSSIRIQMELDVLPVRHVGDVAAVRLARPGDRAELLGGETPAVDPDPQHEELVLELLGLGAPGSLAGHALLPLRVEAPPAHPVAEVLLADRAEAAGREDPLDPLAHLERLGLLLDLLGAVQRLVVAERPLALTSGAWGSSVRCVPSVPSMREMCRRRRQTERPPRGGRWMLRIERALRPGEVYEAGEGLAGALATAAEAVGDHRRHLPSRSRPDHRVESHP